MSMILCGRADVLDLMHPTYVAACEGSYTGQYLKKVLEQ